VGTNNALLIAPRGRIKLSWTIDCPASSTFNGETASIEDNTFVAGYREILLRYNVQRSGLQYFALPA
jgi:hypothetical protein